MVALPHTKSLDKLYTLAYILGEKIWAITKHIRQHFTFHHSNSYKLWDIWRTSQTVGMARELCINEGSMREATGWVNACSAVTLLYFTLTTKMENSIAKLKHFSQLDFQSKRELINNGRPMP